MVRQASATDGAEDDICVTFVRCNVARQMDIDALLCKEATFVSHARDFVTVLCTSS